MKRMMTMVVVSGMALGAAAHEGDIGLKVVDGKIVTGVVSAGGSGDEVIPGQRVFGAEMGLAFPGFADEPGYFAADGSFATGATLGFNVRGMLKAWNGAGYVPAAQTLLIEDPAAINSVVTPASDVLTPGFIFQSVDSTGGFDTHLNFLLSDGNATGVYLLELETTGAGLEKSEAYWVVFNNGAGEEEHDAAIDWVSANLVPGPGAMVVFVGAGVMVRRRRGG